MSTGSTGDDDAFVSGMTWLVVDGPINVYTRDAFVHRHVRLMALIPPPVKSADTISSAVE